MAQRLSAGRGVRHAETNAGPRPLRFVQMWVAPDRPALPPSYEHADLGEALAGGDLVPVAAGATDSPRTPLRLGKRAATLYAARVPGGRAVRLPDAPYLQLYVARGHAEVTGGHGLDDGDEVRFTDVADAGLVAGARAAEILVWEMHDRI
jgi:redox-sensitive bicupin YhaK (pirin superfamily)